MGGEEVDAEEEVGRGMEKEEEDDEMGRRRQSKEGESGRERERTIDLCGDDALRLCVETEPAQRTLRPQTFGEEEIGRFRQLDICARPRICFSFARCPSCARLIIGSTHVREFVRSFVHPLAHSFVHSMALTHRHFLSFHESSSAWERHSTSRLEHRAARRRARRVRVRVRVRRRRHEPRRPRNRRH